ncbi:uncharacterized protein Eint_061140 [Encephalitozoon intestinalis ATCC 50506]|uniref:Uncharacterized protein n=1 Tax=Encephalitozoon intestinalis (strain ATCC 50506) TaxID=876142 RepID=E0S7P2_ENCIT|nr:uncharacterized protein Eint_061140 [Encephalitozoon intestinalis ATCC 50506]ADM11721.2 hypothetical protein Eint_061140 [Encephalitozoon intestinalis ATCC 50506]UTX45459.1 hypothetical protein GPK93_06g10130 [Encephalitozoon intestinalis]
MAKDQEKVYMLLELERIRQLNIPHVYAFPTGTLEFTCAMFRGSDHTVFKLIKSDIYEKWSVLIDGECSEEMNKMSGSCDAHITLETTVQTLSRCHNTSLFGKSKNIFPFISEGFPNREKNITALLLFVKNRCSKTNGCGEKMAIQIKE